MNMPPFPHHPPRVHDPTGLRWLVLDLNSFFASCEQQETPALRGKPVIVVPMLADSTCAIAASYEAKAFGVKTGTRVGDARRMVPGLRIVQARPRLYVTYHHRILDAIESCIPILDVMSVDEVACRLDKTEQTVQASTHLAHAIKRAIHTRVGPCLTSSIGIAPNKLLAKLASDMQKPDGLVLLRHADLPHAFAHLAIEDIPGIGPAMGARLRRAGIPDIPTLFAADASFLRRVWGGALGVRFHALLHGADLPSPPTRRRSLGHQHVLAPDERNGAAARAVSRQLLTRAALRLRQDGFYCRRLYLDIKWDRHLGSWTADQSLQETQASHLLLQVLDHLWTQAPPLRPLRVGIILGDLAPASQHQPDLFAQPKSRNLDNVIDALNIRFGRGVIGYGPPKEPMTSKIAFQRVPDLDEM